MYSYGELEWLVVLSVYVCVYSVQLIITILLVYLTLRRPKINFIYLLQSEYKYVLYSVYILYIAKIENRTRDMMIIGNAGGTEEAQF